MVKTLVACRNIYESLFKLVQGVGQRPFLTIQTDCILEKLQNLLQTMSLKKTDTPKKPVVARLIFLSPPKADNLALNRILNKQAAEIMEKPIRQITDNFVFS